MFTDAQIDKQIGADTTFRVGDPIQEVDCRYIRGEVGIGSPARERIEKIIYAEHNYTTEIESNTSIEIEGASKTVKAISRVSGIVILEL